jgi:hypothetical protein
MKQYIPTIESEASTSIGNVGIWWFHDNSIVGEYCSLDDGYAENGYIKFISKYGYNKVITQIESDSPGVESGEVIYDIRSQVFEIICSPAIASNENVIKKIADKFEISDLRYDVIPSSHYYAPSLTGNLALDNFDFGD